MDFLRVPYGIRDVQNLKAHSVAYAYGRVMHPMHMLESRVASVAELPNYRTERSLKQLRAAILCMRELIIDTLDQAARDPRAVRSALQLSERAFKLAESDMGVRIHVDHKIDLLDAVVLDPRLPSAFVDNRVPQARAVIEANRRDLQRTLERNQQAPVDADDDHARRRGRSRKRSP